MHLRRTYSAFAHTHGLWGYLVLEKYTIYVKNCQTLLHNYIDFQLKKSYTVFGKMNTMVKLSAIKKLKSTLLLSHIWVLDIVCYSNESC